MPYTYRNSKGDTYTLHRTEARLKSSQTRVLHFFSRDVRESAIDELPVGYTVTEAPTGMPLLKKA
jgi:hypothetical protein